MNLQKSCAIRICLDRCYMVIVDMPFLKCCWYKKTHLLYHGLIVTSPFAWCLNHSGNIVNNNVSSVSTTSALLREHHIPKWTQSSVVVSWLLLCDLVTGSILGMRPASERRRYIVTPSLICWAHTQMIPVVMHISGIILLAQYHWSNHERYG